VGDYKNPPALNAGLVVTLLFSLFASYTAALGFLKTIQDAG
jgi:hypothetical protein